MIDLARFALAMCSVVLAAWLVPSSVHIVGWNGSSAQRIAFVPALPALAVPAVLGAIAVVCGLIVRVRCGPAYFRNLARVVAPLCLLLVWGLPYLPWLADRFPLLLVFAGPVRWLIAAAAVIGCATTMLAGRRTRWSVKAPGSPTVFAISLLVSLGLGFYVTGVLGPGGDEPHYLVITHSLLEDHDLQIDNNYAHHDYRAFFKLPLRPNFIQRGAHGEMYSIHPPGLPALLVPAYAAAGYRGAVAVMCLLSAATALLIFRLAKGIAGPSAAVFAWIATAFTIPLGVHSWMVYPEVPAALIVAASAWWLWTVVPESALLWMTRGLLLGALPWLHAKFIVLLVGLVVCLLIRVRRRPVAALALIAPAAASVAFWVYAFYVMYGVLDPFIPYGPASLGRLSNSAIPRGVLGLLFDQEFGLLTFSPVYALAFAGLATMLARREERFYALAALFCGAAFVAGVTRTFMWWGGTSAPARFLVPVVPLFAPMLAKAFDQWRGVRRGMAIAALIVSGAIFGYVSLLAQPRLIAQNRDGVGAFVDYVQAGAPLTAVLPSFIEEDWLAPSWRVVPWLGALFLGVSVARWIGRRMAPGAVSIFWSGVSVTIVTLAGGGVLASPLIPTAKRESIVNDGRLALLDAYDPTRLTAFDYLTLHRLDGPRVLARASPVVTPAVEPESVVLCGPFDLPPGEYEVALRVSRPPADAGVLRVVSMIRNRRSILASRSVGAGEMTLRFELPARVRRVSVEGTTAAIARLVDRVEIRPRSVVPSANRPDGVDAHTLRPIGSSGAYLFFLDDNTYPEAGFAWVKGGQRGTLLVAASGGRTVHLTVQQGAWGGAVYVSMDGRETGLNLGPWESRELQFTVRPHSPFIPIAIAASGGFRPSEVDPKSRDTRWLGCRFSVSVLTS